MKKLMIAFATVMTLNSCSKEEQILEAPSEIVGTWQLIEVLADPGDGSGVYQSVNSDQTITFHSNGTFTSSESLCSSSLQEDGSTGAYDIAEMIIEPSNCSFSYSYRFENSNLILNPPCIEPCGQKYKKQNSKATDR